MQKPDERQETKKSKRGGARPGAGRKSKWGERTVVMRVPESLRDEVQEFVRMRTEGVVLVREDELAEPTVQQAASILASRARSGSKRKPIAPTLEQDSLFDLEEFG